MSRDDSFSGKVANEIWFWSGNGGYGREREREIEGVAASNRSCDAMPAYVFKKAGN